MRNISSCIAWIRMATASRSFSAAKVSFHIFVPLHITFLVVNSAQDCPNSDLFDYFDLDK